MAHAPLATEADLLARWPLLDDAQTTTALAVASDLVRDAAGAVISATTSTLTFNAQHDTFLRLPGPVTAVTSVTVAGVDVTGYDIEADGLHYGRGWASGTIVITFTHGLPEVPADIVDLTCNLAKAWLDHVREGGGSTAGLTSVRLDDGAEGYSDESAGQVSPVFVPDVTRQWLRARFGGGAAVVGTR
jgi:hypothetical protein